LTGRKLFSSSTLHFSYKLPLKVHSKISTKHALYSKKTLSPLSSVFFQKISNFQTRLDLSPSGGYVTSVVNPSLSFAFLPAKDIAAGSFCGEWEALAR
jgi:hypothetical protein